MVDKPRANSRGSYQDTQIFEWVSKLTQQQVFNIADKNRIVTTENIKQIITTLNLDKILPVIECYQLLDFYEGKTAKFSIFALDLINLIEQNDRKRSSDAYNTPADRIVKSLKTLNSKIKDKALNKEINYAINNINQRKVYETIDLDASLPSTLKTKNSDMRQWLEEFSGIKSQKSNEKDLKQVRNETEERRKSQIKVNKLKNMLTLEKEKSIRTLLTQYEKYEEHLENVNHRLFDLFDFNDLVGRQNTLPILGINLIYQHGLDQVIDERKYALFLDRVYNQYKREVQYHNDLHGIDVAHMANLFLTQGGLMNLLELNQNDILAFLVSGFCHDLGHDGYTNQYHINALTDRAIKYNDISVQENYHVAESFAIIKQSDSNFTDKLSKAEFSVFRKRMIGCILATDMSKHAADLSTLKSIVENKGIQQGRNSKSILEKENEASIFKSQQFILECSMHACDLSQQSRSFKIAKGWTYLVYEEFFQQGDLEKEQGLPISYLCNRETTNVPKCQPGFLTHVVVPLWVQLAEIMPLMNEYLQGLKENSKAWETYIEDEKDLKCYVK